jgi:hypothetical protein
VSEEIRPSEGEATGGAAEEIDPLLLASGER